MGGKRQLANDILKHVKPKEKAPVFADAFMGGGSVSLLAKAKGYQVLSNDSAYRSEVIGRALIENDEIKIHKADLMRLTMPIKNDGFVQRKYTPKIFTTKQAQFLDNAMAHIAGEKDQTKQSLLTLLLIKHIIGVRNFGKFTHTKDAQELEARRFDYPLRTRSHSERNLRHITHPYEAMRPIAQHINEAIFRNGRENQTFQMDAIDFIKSIKADTAYFDPPYADTSSYENEYKVLDEIISDSAEAKTEGKNPWSDSKTARLEFEKLFKAAKHIPNWLISMGQTNSESGINAKELAEMVKKYRDCYVVEFEHRWSVGNAGGEKAPKNKEYLIVTK